MESESARLRKSFFIFLGHQTCGSLMGLLASLSIPEHPKALYSTTPNGLQKPCQLPMFSCCFRWRSRSLANSSGERCGVCSVFWIFAMAVLHAGAWWAASGLRVIATITLADSELLLLGVEASGYLDIGLVYRLRQKESAVGFEDLVEELLEAV